jgi:Ca2+-transporting ATPase
MTPAETIDRKVHAQTAEDVLKLLRADPQRGLGEQEVRARLERYGPNELEAEPPVPAWRRFVAQFQNVLVLLLIAAALTSVILWIVEGDSALPYEGLVILAIVILNAVLGFVQESRAERAVAALRAMAAAEARVLRDGEEQRCPARDVVPGDILLIEEGDAIPADARLLTVVELHTQEASLTGESTPVSKNIAPVPEDVSLGDRHDMVFSGTVASSGRGRAVVTTTGMNTELGRIAGMLKRPVAEVTPLQRELDRTGQRIAVGVGVIAVVIIATLVGTAERRDTAHILEALLFGVALAVAAIPEGLAAVITAVLAIGVQRMARRGAIVRKLPAVETLGAATVIASDKTGTLTRNEMTVSVLATASGPVEISGAGYAPEGTLQARGGPLSGVQQTEVQELLEAAALANNASLRQHDGAWVIHGDPTEGALVVAARKAGLREEELNAQLRRVGEIPFSSVRKRMSTLHQDSEHGRQILFCKGAVDVLLSLCTQERRNGETVPLTDSRRREIRTANEQMARQALRTLAVASRSWPENAVIQMGEDLEQDLVLLGLAGMIDSARPEASAAVERARRAGIRPIMITGDHPVTAKAIASQLGLTQNGRVVTGPELESMDAETLSTVARECSVYARVDPEHKLRLVEALKAQGEVVAMTGDGVNDAPALKRADIGVAMGIAGTDVAKEAADMVLTDDNFATIVAAVEEGRTIYANIQKFLRYLLSSNAGEVLTIFGGVVLGEMLGLRGVEGMGTVLALTASQILWINLVTDGPPALALGLDPPEPDVMRHPPRSKKEAVIDKEMLATVVLIGLVMAVGTLGVLDASLPGGLLEGSGDLAYGRTMAFTTLVLFQLFNLFNSRSERRSAFSPHGWNQWLWGAVALSVALQAMVVYTPFLRAMFGVEELSMRDWLVCGAVASTVLWAAEVSKVFRRWRHSERG